MKDFETALFTRKSQSGHMVSEPKSKWADSLGFCLAFSLLVGILYPITFMGPRVLNPRDLGWLTQDPISHYVGWELFRHDPKWHWPLTYTTYLGYPVGESAALMDFNSLLALAFKPFSSILPEPFQYFGIEIVLCCTLIYFFAWRLLRLLVGPNIPGILIASAFFLTSPPLTHRMACGHYSLSNHWVLIAALLLFFRLQVRAPQSDFRDFVGPALILAAVVIAINPYLAFEVLLVLTAAVVSLLWERRLSWTKAAGFLLLLGLVCAFVAYSLGFFISGGKGYGSEGYRYFSMNLLSPIDSIGLGWIIRTKLPYSTGGQYEGYNYLGAGIILLTALVVSYLVYRRGQLKLLDKRWAVPLFLCCLVLTLMAFSTRISFGSHTVIDLDPHEKLTRFLAPLRASGRLFWLPYYTFLIAVLAVPLLVLRRTWANALLAVLLIVQVADTAPLRRFVHSVISQGYADPLRSPVWSKLGSVHRNLVVLPPWQCDKEGSPGGISGYGIFGLLAADQKMATNSYYSARYTEVSREFHCTQSVTDLAEKPLSPDTAYVVSPALAAIIADGPTGPGKCHDLDGFILCSTASDFGLGPILKTAAERLQDAIRDPGFEDNDLTAWPPFENAKSSVSTSQVHSGLHSLAQSEGEGSVDQDISRLEPGRVYLVSAWVSASPGATVTSQIALWSASSNLATFSQELRATPQWQLLTHQMAAGTDGILRLHLFRKSGSGTLYWDDVTVTVLK